MKHRLVIAAATTLAAFAAGITAYAAGGMPSMGRSGSIQRPSFHAYYDGHKDTFLSTDVSDRAEAAQMHVNYAPALKKVPIGATEAMYMVEGRAAAGQIPVFSSEPGEASYTPLWHEVMVRWKPGMTPVLLTKDDQIKALAAKGKLTVMEMHVILNCPIVHPTKSTVSGGSS